MIGIPQIIIGGKRFGVSFKVSIANFKGDSFEALIM